ncbi:Uncharacterised protein [uncultured archaeon]|nr:Uncharacterised protein [uncultured archaeon]
MLSDLFGEPVIFTEVTYMPYYSAKIVDAEGRFREETLFAPKFNQEVPAGGSI